MLNAFEVYKMLFLGPTMTLMIKVISGTLLKLEIQPLVSDYSSS